jgi:hypothetical protein
MDWIQIFGQMSLLTGASPEIHVRNRTILTSVPDKFSLAVFSAAPISRRLYQLCLSAKACDLPIFETVSQMLSDESKPISLRLGFDDLTVEEYKVLSKQPHAPFIHLCPQILFILSGLVQLPEYLEHLEQIPADKTLVFDRETFARIGAGFYPNINILPSGESPVNLIGVTHGD